MSFLSGALGNVLGATANDDHAKVASALLQHLNSQPGALTNTIEGFHRAGLGQQANSWVSNGANQPVSPDEVQQGMGTGLINSIASRAGVSPSITKTALAMVLPAIVNHLSPQGQIPDQSSLTSRLEGLLGKVA